MANKNLTKDEYKLAQRRASEILNNIMPRRRKISGMENIERSEKYQELLRKEISKIRERKKK